MLLKPLQDHRHVTVYPLHKCHRVTSVVVVVISRWSYFCSSRDWLLIFFAIADPVSGTCELAFPCKKKKKKRNCYFCNRAICLAFLFQKKSEELCKFFLIKHFAAANYQITFGWRSVNNNVFSLFLFLEALIK